MFTRIGNKDPFIKIWLILNGEQMVSNLCFVEKSLERDTGQRVRFKSLIFFFLFFLTPVGDFLVKYYY